MYDSPNDVLEYGLFQLSGETSCLLTTSVQQATKRACCLLLSVFLKAWVIAQFWNWRSKGFPKTDSNKVL